MKKEYLTGLVKLEHRLLILLDIDKILCEEDIAVVDGMTGDES